MKKGPKGRSVVGRDSFAEVDIPKRELREYEQQLAIDPDDLDECLVRSPELVYHVAEQVTLAIAQRDATKLELDEAIAEEDNKIRALAEKNDEKITEAFVLKQIAVQPVVQDLQRKLLEAKRQVGLWEAMRDGHKQRSYALSTLAELAISRMGGSGTVSSAAAYVNTVAERNHARAGEERVRRRKERG